MVHKPILVLFHLGNQLEVYRLRTFRPETVRPAGQP
jgi:hypothetical protein